MALPRNERGAGFQNRDAEQVVAQPRRAVESSANHKHFSKRRTPMLLSLALPIVLSAVALFFASFLSWMVLQLHKKDWVKLEKEEEFMAAAGPCTIPPRHHPLPTPSHSQLTTP